MKKLTFLVVLVAAGICLGMLGSEPIAGQAARTGKLILWGDLAMFQPPGHPENCIAKNRFKKGEPAGFRFYAIDGGTGLPETTTEIVVHITYAGKKVDLPVLYRGVAHTNPATGQPMPVRANQWTARWVVPNDAPVGIVRWTASARDKYGRTVEFSPQGGEPSWLTVVQ
jgi:hypothetical protein